MVSNFEEGRIYLSLLTRGQEMNSNIKESDGKSVQKEETQFFFWKKFKVLF